MKADLIIEKECVLFLWTVLVISIYCNIRGQIGKQQSKGLLERKIWLSRQIALLISWDYFKLLRDLTIKVALQSPNTLMNNVFSKRILSTLFILPHLVSQNLKVACRDVCRAMGLKNRNEEMGSMKYKYMKIRQESE